MGTETFVLTVLPLTQRAAAPFHVSLHIAPRLVPDAAEEPLKAFDTFVEWAARLRGGNVVLFDQANAVIPATPLFDGFDPDLWSRVLPPDTPVRRPDFGTFANRDWRSFPAKTVHDMAALVNLYSTLLFPIDPPDFKNFLLTNRENPLFTLIGRLGHSDERALTAELDDPAGKSDNPWVPLLRPLHAARRFYERREATQDYRRRPVEGLASAKLPVPRPDFHERVTHMADQPAMLRRLGLVIDLRVDDPALLAKASVLHARIDLRGSGAEVIAARTPVTRLGDRLMTTPRTGDWTGGRLRLGDEKLFATLAMDSDGAALKLENYVRSLPRMLAMAVNGDPGNVAPAGLRSEGLTVVRQARLDGVKAQIATAGAMVGTASASKPPTIATEDVTRGFRVDVWDDHERKWFSPHLRLATATLVDGPPIYTDLPEAGCVQTAAVQETPGVAASPLYLHEALFGWSGWSLSAPRPGPRAVPDGPKEKVEEAQVEAKISGVTIDTRVMPGTLPRLRYGRSYAFRAWGVDLAGNAQGGNVPAKFNAAVTTSLRLPADPRRTDVRPSPPVVPPRRSGEPPVRERVASVAEVHPDIHGLAVRLAGDSVAPAPVDSLNALRGAGALDIAAAITGVAEVDRIVTARLSTRAARAAPRSTAELAGETLRRAVPDVQLDTAQPIRPEMLDALDLDPATQTGPTITPLTPFRRWDPVPPPVLVARHRFSAAESVHHLVIRSGVGSDGTITAPDAYLAEVAAADPAHAQDWRATSERHLVAPKGSQHLNELHGRFDPAIPGDPAQRRLFLAAALRDDGTLFDRSIVDLGDPASTLPQPGVTLEAGPEVVDPVDDLSLFEGENRGDPIPPGHYIVHDTDQLEIPYLPDPLAAGVALGMPGANIGSPLFGLFRTESTTAPWRGAWPAPQPCRLVLDTAPQAHASVAAGTIAIGLPPGTKLDLRVSSSLRREELPLLALWMLIPAALRDLDLIERPAADGQFWSLTPFEKVTLVHAVPRPVLPPLITTMITVRAPDATNALFAAVIDCHAQSSERLDCEASWSEWVDDISADGPELAERQSIAFQLQPDLDEDMLVLGPVDTTFPLPGVGTVKIHGVKQEFGDTRHRLVDYRFRAGTRFREYFAPSQLATVDSRTIVGPVKQLRQQSTARPPAPVIDSVIPLFRWDEQTDPGQPFGLRRRRRSGLRIYLERPWYRTGDDEQLAVLLGGPGSDSATVSVWGSDPVWFNAGPPNQLVGLAVEDLYASLGLDDVRGEDPRISPPALLPLVDVVGRPMVTALGYRPEYNLERKLWYVDVAIEPAAAVWPFVRLAVARYQPHSLPGRELSPVVLCDFAQLVPERTMTVSRPDAGNVRVTVSGPIGLRASLGKTIASLGKGDTAPEKYPLGAADPTNLVAQDRRVYASVERRAAGEISDLDWQVVTRRELSIGGVSPAGEWAWTGVVPVLAQVGPATPGKADEWRVTVEEMEGIEGDPADLDTAGPLVKQWRLIYADRTLL